MDTRKKIVALDVALDRTRGERTAVVTGHFDPLLVEHVRRLSQIKSGNDRLVAVLSDPPNPVLDSRSRAQLLAALDMIDYVVLPQECASSVEPNAGGHALVYREEAADEARFERLVAHVHRRHQSMVCS